MHFQTDPFPFESEEIIAKYQISVTKERNPLTGVTKAKVEVCQFIPNTQDQRCFYRVTKRLKKPNFSFEGRSATFSQEDCKEAPENCQGTLPFKFLVEVTAYVTDMLVSDGFRVKTCMVNGETKRCGTV